jgi:hypothetical protein
VRDFVYLDQRGAEVPPRTQLVVRAPCGCCDEWVLVYEWLGLFDELGRAIYRRLW